MSQHLYTVNMFKGRTQIRNLHDSSFVLLFDHFEIISVRKIIFW